MKIAILNESFITTHTEVIIVFHEEHLSEIVGLFRS